MKHLPESLARPWWGDVLWALVLGGWLAAAVGWLASERRAVMSLEPPVRAAVFQHSWEGFRQLCLEQPPDGLADRCHEQARFLSLFPECDDACREQTRFQARAMR